MHIVFLAQYLPVTGTATGGAGNYVANMAAIMNRFGHKVTIITEAEEKETVYWEDIEIRKIRATRGFRNTGRPLPVYKKFLKNICRSIFYNWEVYKISKTGKIDIVQSVSSFGIPMLRVKKIPYIVRVSEYQPLWSGAKKINFNFQKCMNAKHIDEEIILIGIKRADKVVVPSFFMDKLIEGKTKRDAIVIESPIVIGDEERLKLREKEVTSQKYWITYSVMSYRKEIHILAEIIDDLLDKYPDMKYVMVGRDVEVNCGGKFMKASSFFDEHIKRNKERFVFLGEISDRERLFSLVKNAYACILPTRVDNLPNTCLEAMALGKIVVSSTSEYGTSVEQLVTDGYNGFLAQVDDAGDLARKIVHVMQLTPEEKNLIEGRAKERVKDLTPEKVYEKMMEVYSTVLRP